jgi:Ca2+-binding EF-hand superfamily protein
MSKQAIALVAAGLLVAAALPVLAGHRGGDHAEHAAFALAFTAVGADANRDGDVTREEWNAWFVAQDKNGDGVLSAAERPEKPEGLHRHFGGFMKLLDTDADGSVSRAEWDAMASRHHPQADPQKAGEHFEELDTNDDGVLSQDELRAGHRRHRHDG